MTKALDTALDQLESATQAQHTQGPWFLEPVKNNGLNRPYERFNIFHRTPPCYDNSYGVDTGSKYVPVCVVRTQASKSQTEANARLIAAAPELLEAAEQSLIHLEVMVLPYAKDKDEISSVKDVIEICKAAIAKARGQE